MKRKMTKKFNKLLAMCIMVITQISVMQPINTYAKEVEGKATPSGIAYEDIEQEINKFIDERKEGCASVSVEVFEGNTTICKKQYGYSDMNNKVLVDDNTVYEWGSVSKLLVWTSVMQLYEDGKVDFDTDVREYLPEGFLTKLSYEEPITILNLMNHNAGWQETTYDIEVKDASDIVDLETALKYSEPSQIYEPGTVTAYSNWGTALAAFIVEQISGDDYVEYVHKNILEPLGMENTSVGADFSDNQWVKEQRNMLNCYSVMQDYYQDYGNAIRYILLYPAGSAAGTLEDFATFSKTFTLKDNENCNLFKEKETLAIMKTATSYYGDKDIARNCHGFWTLQYKKDVMGHNGNTSGCTSTFMFESVSGLGIVIMTNEMGETAFNYGLLSLLYGDYSENERVLGNSFSDSEDLSGIYTLSRTYNKGFVSIYKYLGSLMPLVKTENLNEFNLAINDGTLTKVAEHQYIMDNGNGWRYLMNEMVDDHGNTVLQMMSADVIKENTVLFIFKALGILFMVLVVIFSIMALVINGISYVIRIIREKEKVIHSRKMNISHTINLFINILIGIVFYCLIILPLDGGVVKPFPVMLKCTLLGILSLYSILNLVVIIRYWKEYEMKLKSKVKYIVFTSASCYLTVFIWYWKLFDFWSC